MNEETKIITARIRQDLQSKSWEQLINALLVAEEYDVSKILLKKAFTEAGKYLFSQEKYFEAIIHFNKARIRDLNADKVFQLFINAVDSFFKNNVEEFSKQDLLEFKQTILPIINFHKINNPDHKKIIDTTEHMFRRIDYCIRYTAKDVEESKLTFPVQQIKNSLYGNMTPEEVRQEFARLNAMVLRDILSKEEPKDDKDTKKRTTVKKKHNKKDK
jgi:tetratricopeptide (TPR) repeat protein